jgi:LacI family gluconate utilization system Gnt-I transcriptional repressor
MVAGRRSTAQMVASADRPDAIYFSNDDLAAGGIMHCLSEGIEIPSELALAGFNGLSFLEALPIRLTTVETPRLEMGRRAAAHVMQASEPSESLPSPSVIDLGFRLIPGETC